MRNRRFDLYKIQDKRVLTDSTFVLRMERKGLEFVAGQHIQVGPPNGIHTREYSIYSAPHEDYLEILVREIEDGVVTPSLKRLEPGDSVVINNAVGYFTIDQAHTVGSRFLFVASGTGISPFHSFIKSYPQLDYTLIHGIRTASEAYDRADYDATRYIACTSRDEKGDFHGRVTHWLEKNRVEPGTLCFLCGNCDMIHDVYDILELQGVSSMNIFTEVYF